jgi:hypothetical protein
MLGFAAAVLFITGLVGMLPGRKRNSRRPEISMDWQPIRFITGPVLYSKLGSKKEVFTELVLQEAVIPPP